MGHQARNSQLGAAAHPPAIRTFPCYCCFRLRPPGAASVPTGHAQSEEQDSVAWFREQQFVSR